MTPDRHLERSSAEALRREFDRGFALPAQAPEDDSEDLLVVGSGGERFALRLSGIAGLDADRKIVALPGAVPELLGLAGVRGGLVAIYDLRALLGSAPSASPRWIVLLAGEKGVGLACEEIGGLVRLSAHELTSGAALGPGQGILCEVAHTGGAVLPVVDVASIVESIRRLARRAGPPEER